MGRAPRGCGSAATPTGTWWRSRPSDRVRGGSRGRDALVNAAEWPLRGPGTLGAEQILDDALLVADAAIGDRPVCIDWADGRLTPLPGIEGQIWRGWNFGYCGAGPGAWLRTPRSCSPPTSVTPAPCTSAPRQCSPDCCPWPGQTGGRLRPRVTAFWVVAAVIGSRSSGPVEQLLGDQADAQPRAAGDQIARARPQPGSDSSSFVSVECLRAENGKRRSCRGEE